MSLWMLAGGGWGPPFNRTFFNVNLGELLEQMGKDKRSQLTLFLIDGTQLEIRSIEDICDQYVVVRAFLRDEDGDDRHLHVLPYASIYRMELVPSSDHAGRRLGFQWSSSVRKGSARKASRTNGASSSQPEPVRSGQ